MIPQRFYSPTCGLQTAAAILLFLLASSCPNVALGRLSAPRRDQGSFIPLPSEGVAPEIFIVHGMSGALIAPGISEYETPLAIRFSNYYRVLAWNCIATYSDSYKDTITKEKPAVAVPVTEMHQTPIRAACAAQAFVTYTSLSMPQGMEGLTDFLNSIGISHETTMPESIAECPEGDVPCLQEIAASGSFSPTVMGHIVARMTYDYSLKDGFNQLGTDDGCTYNCRDYSDVTGYEPQSPACKKKKQGKKSMQRWVPMMEDDGKGFFYKQEHVTPHIGTTAKFRFTPENARKRVAPKPSYSKSLRKEAQAVVERMSTLDDTKKLEVEVFDDKGRVTESVVSSLAFAMVEQGYVESVLDPKPGIAITYERGIQFLMGLEAANLDSIIMAWKEKVAYDLIRPTTVIKNWGSEQITTWAGPGNDVQTFSAKNFEAYKRVMPHSEYVSGSACLFQYMEDFLTYFTTKTGIDPNFPIVFPPVPPGGSNVEPNSTPSSEIQLIYPNITAMAYAGSESRLNGGMHFGDSVPGAKKLCQNLGQKVAKRVLALTGDSFDFPYESRTERYLIMIHQSAIEAFSLWPHWNSTDRKQKSTSLYQLPSLTLCPLYSFSCIKQANSFIVHLTVTLRKLHAAPDPTIQALVTVATNPASLGASSRFGPLAASKHYSSTNTTTTTTTTTTAATMRSLASPPLSLPTAAKLFGVGATVGPLVDSLHNQCLLRYHYAPIDIVSPFATAAATATTTTTADAAASSLILATSWAVPPLLGLAYVVLGSVLPRLFQKGLDAVAAAAATVAATTNHVKKSPTNLSPPTNVGSNDLQARAVVAVLTTAAIIKLSDYLVLHPTATADLLPLPSTLSLADQHIALLLALALLQWAVLDGTLAALLAASVTSVGGPLSELPFVAGDIWQYLPEAGDYLPLQNIVSSDSGSLWSTLLGADYNQLALSSITGPCYFAVTMDAIALGRWFDEQQEQRDV
eukprot:CAMPEP_0168735780 /NCGR_PEP_ID=MMETSP0724-20121128/9516_1 /TAXON_ID=265536 /ORGANISM="Amphiprora sp., Strain CCMP467" /LENGTH=968 /DNA_ID=CAMNT_0008782947 /DNA_START=93 /DNA_END=3001 /DNA_ORIENTATION=-